MRLARYLSLYLIKLSIVATLILAFIAEILDLVENAPDILSTGEGVPGILRYVMLRMPTLLVHSLPLGTLVGALLTLLLLARNSEIVAMRSAGRSTFNIFVAMMRGAFLLVVLHSTFIDVISPMTEAKLAISITQRIEKKQERTDRTKANFLRIDDAIVSFDRVSNGGRRIRGVRIYDRDPQKLVTSRIMAEDARYRDGKWTLTNAERVTWTRGEAFNQKTNADGVWETSLTPDDILATLSPESRIALTAARKVLAGEQTPNAPLPFYQTLVERVYAAPLGLIVMVLLAMPASLVNWRDARSGRYGFIALASGLFFLLGDGVMRTLGLTGVVDPAIGAWSGLLLFAAFGSWRIWRMDGQWRPQREPRGPRASGGSLAEANA